MTNSKADISNVYVCLPNWSTIFIYC